MSAATSTLADDVHIEKLTEFQFVLLTTCRTVISAKYALHILMLVSQMLTDIKVCFYLNGSTCYNITISFRPIMNYWQN